MANRGKATTKEEDGKRGGRATFVREELPDNDFSQYECVNAAKGNAEEEKLPTQPL